MRLVLVIAAVLVTSTAAQAARHRHVHTHPTVHRFTEHDIEKAQGSYCYHNQVDCMGGS